MKTFAIFLVLILSAAVYGQVTIADSPFLYKSPDNHPDCSGQECFVDLLVLNSQHRDVPIRVRYPRGTSGPLPFILWSHGGGPNELGREINEPWGRTLARAGYIVVHMSHFWSAEQRGAACLEFGVTDQTACVNEFPIGSLFRPRDANVVLSSLSFIEQSIPALNNRIDRNRIAVAGWSYGSTTAITLAGARLKMSDSFPDVSFVNPLPKAFMALSPMSSPIYGYKPDSWREVTRPVLFGTGASDVAPGDDASTRRIPFQSVQPREKYELFIDHPAAIHDSFNLTNEDYPIFSQWLASYALAYFDSKLKGYNLAGYYLISGRLPLNGSRKVVEIQRK